MNFMEQMKYKYLTPYKRIRFKNGSIKRFDKFLLEVKVKRRIWFGHKWVKIGHTFKSTHSDYEEMVEHLLWMAENKRNPFYGYDPTKKLYSKAE